MAKKQSKRSKKVNGRKGVKIFMSFYTPNNSQYREQLVVTDFTGHK